MASYFITGATGFIGHLIVEKLLKEEADAKIFALVRSREKALQMYAGENDRLVFVESDLEHLSSKLVSDSIDYMIHCAAVTTSKVMIEKPVEVADGIILGTKNVLEMAREKKVKSLVFLSSMEAYGDVPDTGARRKEHEVGVTSLTSPRSCYPLGKKMAELYCYLYATEYGVPVKVARLAQVFGLGLLPGENRVFMQFAKSARDKKDIVLKTAGMSLGNYCESMDAVNGILTILHKGQNGETYNVVNEENTMRIRDMAELVAKEIAGGEIQLVFDIADPSTTGYAADTGLRMSGEKLRALGWTAEKSMKDMYEEILSEL